jgi:hypothetical protein
LMNSLSSYSLPILLFKNKARKKFLLKKYSREMIILEIQIFPQQIK